MPRRIYEYPAANDWGTYNLISTIGSFILAAGVLVTAVNILISVKKGAIAGPDPWKANTLEWFTESPPPANNFDAIPYVRSVEPMKDIRREVERQTGAHQREPRAGPMEASRVSTSTAAVPALAGLRQVAADYLTLTKPKVQSLLLFTTVATMYVAGDPSVTLVALTCLGGYLQRRGRGSGQPLLRPRHRRPDGAHGQPARALRARLAPGRPVVRPGAGRPVLRRADPVRQPARGPPRLLGLPGLHARLHDVAQAHDAAEHRDRRRRGRRPAPRRLGRGDRHLDWTALYLFAIVFYWTPPHFWSLSLLMKDEYEKVGVPMMPVVRGERETRKQILLYTLLLYAVTQLPFCAGGFGAIYLAASMVLGLAFIAGSVVLYRRADRRTALRLYLFSLSTWRCSTARWSSTPSL